MEFFWFTAPEIASAKIFLRCRHAFFLDGFCFFEENYDRLRSLYSSALAGGLEM
jgi:hypothetical protein